ncbi:Myeloid leukemia factor 1 [Cricetulus griseus]|uniref:Myeloid leukemia factor 1 n=1 Tax=Cricetulus griseus TaxID=10029 RepID=G3I520_CRIGR|nr:Myeloid leukemia factor 1 [Cricetulus griseus]
MAVGHHIHDRAHVIKKSKDNRTGDEEVNQEFINMNECDAHSFDNEWKSEVLKFKPSGRPCNLENTRIRSVGHDNSGPRELKRRERKFIEVQPLRMEDDKTFLWTNSMSKDHLGKSPKNK